MYTENSTSKETSAGEGRVFKVSSDTSEEASSSVWGFLTAGRRKLLWSGPAWTGEPEEEDQATSVAAGV